MKVSPGAATKVGGTHTREVGRQHVVVQPITDIEDGLGGNSRGIDDPSEEVGIRLADASMRRRSDEVGPQPGSGQLLVKPLGLITCNPDA